MYLVPVQQRMDHMGKGINSSPDKMGCGMFGGQGPQEGSKGLGVWCPLAEVNHP